MLRIVGVELDLDGVAGDAVRRQVHANAAFAEIDDGARERLVARVQLDRQIAGHANRRAPLVDGRVARQKAHQPRVDAAAANHFSRIGRTRIMLVLRQLLHQLGERQLLDTSHHDLPKEGSRPSVFWPGQHPP